MAETNTERTRRARPRGGFVHRDAFDGAAHQLGLTFDERPSAPPADRGRR